MLMMAFRRGCPGPASLGARVVQLFLNDYNEEVQIKETFLRKSKNVCVFGTIIKSIIAAFHVHHESLQFYILYGVWFITMPIAGLIANGVKTTYTLFNGFLCLKSSLPT